MEKVTNNGVPLMSESALIQVDKENAHEALVTLCDKGIGALEFKNPWMPYIVNEIESIIQGQQTIGTSDEELKAMQQVAVDHSYAAAKEINKDDSIMMHREFFEIGQYIKSNLDSYADKHFTDEEKTAVKFDAWFK